MPNTKSAKKRLRQDEAKRAHNRSIKTAVKTKIKKVVSACNDGNVELAETEFRVAAKALDQAGSRGIIHKNCAARGKSRLQRLIKKSKSA